MSGAAKVVVFDLGGVVVRICRSWVEGCRAAGVPHRAEAEACFAQPRARALLDEHQRGALACRAFHEGLAECMGGIYTPAELEAVHAAWTREDYPGIAGVVDRIHIAGFDTACLSNTNASHWALLRSSPALARIRHQHASHVLGLAKPDAAIYRAFERATGYTAAGIIFFDDLAENVAAAQACGWLAVQVDHTGDTAAQVVSGLARHGVHV